MVVAVRGRRPSATHVDIEIKLGSYSSISVSGKYCIGRIRRTQSNSIEGMLMATMLMIRR